MLALVATATGSELRSEPAMAPVTSQTSNAPEATQDSDGDGLPDLLELSGWATLSGNVYRTDPVVADTDGDGLTDGAEAGGLVANASAGYAHVGYANPLLADTDGDQLDDGAEADLGLNPLDPDSDDDELEDGREVAVVGTSPAVADTDGDGLSDGYEDANLASRGLDPLMADVEISKMSYATDFAKGLILGDLNREDSLAWLAGNLASGGSSLVPGVGWVLGGVADARDVVGSAIHADWVGSGFSAAGLVPAAGDSVAVAGKAAEFVARNPELAAAVGFLLASLHKIPEAARVEASKAIWKHWDDLRDAGASEKTLLRLQMGRTDLDQLGQALTRSAHVPGSPASFYTDWKDGERYLEDLYGASAKGSDWQVPISTLGCQGACNITDRRIFDVLVDGVAHESKVGYKYLTPELERQIRSDAYLIQSGAIEGAHWHFFASAITNKIGADSRVFDLLDEVGIPYSIHLPS
ncbi:hypothetical protein [Nocardioides sp.]|uniref:hypothetical protein n=1 Tax=Nocardioides sp. TaxID=35761 RepID=UPI0025DBE942|nr:hypothetical protein [Nocardioides sp.]